MRNEDSGTALQTDQVKVAPTRAAAPQFDNKAKPAPVATTAAKPRLDQDSKAALS